ncbi:MAG: branched-chain amino acid ABC transporter permease, partial [Thermoleophilia bacterium]|nr:branched-chain amino acid ABC transporter permease [Thermoleophilia bacterium]
MQTSRIRDGVRAALPLAVAPLLFGAAFGVLALDAGL